MAQPPLDLDVPWIPPVDDDSSQHNIYDSGWILQDENVPSEEELNNTLALAEKVMKKQRKVKLVRTSKGKTNAELKHNLLNSNWHVVDTWSNNPEKKVDKPKGGQFGFPKRKLINNKTPTKPKPIQRRNKIIGAKALIGLKGLKGMIGLKGLKGAKALIGLKALRGLKGSKALRGLKGFKGLKG